MSLDPAEPNPMANYGLTLGVNQIKICIANVTHYASLMHYFTLYTLGTGRHERSKAKN